MTRPDADHSSPTLPIDALRADVLARLAEGPVVVSAPTGSGKSTQIPRWCATDGHRVLVVEPRRVACRALAQRVAELEGSRLGGRVGYRVRDDDRTSAETGILFVTPGIVLRMLGAADDAALTDRFHTLILDELHERRLDVDLILALCMARGVRRLLAMSATVDGDRVAEHLGGVHLAGEGRLFPVDIRHREGRDLLPSPRDLDARVASAVSAAAGDPGDILVFLPGKAEIVACASRLAGRDDLQTVELHGGLSLDQQSRAFGRSKRRKVILATNVAETSLTVPGVGVVIDSGLVRRTRYHQGRGYLTRVPIALDSADQRAGRAGRTSAGVCYRLWSPSARLQAATPPEIHRESLVPLVMASAAAGADAARLPFLDPPKPHALEHAVEELRVLGALPSDRTDALSERGRAIFGLPLDAWQGQLLVEARARGALDDAIDLVAALSVDRRLFSRPVPAEGPDEDDLRAAGCDAVAAIKAVRGGRPDRDGVDRYAMREARAARRRLRRAWSLEGEGPRGDEAIDRERLLAVALAADPRCAYVARRRKRHLAWGNGGTEIELGRESAVLVEGKEAADAIVVLASRALDVKVRDARVIATCAMPVTHNQLLAAGLGRDRLASVALERRRIVARIERVHAGKVLGSREETPEGALARDAIRDLFLRGTLFKGGAAQARERFEARALQARLDGGAGPGATVEAWLDGQLERLGVESGDDLELLSVDDLLPPALPAHVQARLDRDYPRRLDTADAKYALHYDLAAREVVLEKLSGRKGASPPVSFLPRLPGLRVLVRDKSRTVVLRERR